MTEVKIETLYEMASDIDIFLRDSADKLEFARETLQFLKNNLEKYAKKSSKESQKKKKLMGNRND
jgi:hypothetical protein